MSTLIFYVASKCSLIINNIGKCNPEFGGFFIVLYSPCTVYMYTKGHNTYYEEMCKLLVALRQTCAHYSL